MHESVAPIDAAPEQAAILVGGLGTRLRPLGTGCPKPLLEVGGHSSIISSNLACASAFATSCCWRATKRLR
jgi:mannose-1-phosphate guanylyltransferase